MGTRFQNWQLRVAYTYNQLITGVKAMTTYHVRNGRAQKLLLSSLLCSAIDSFNFESINGTA